MLRRLSMLFMVLFFLYGCGSEIDAAQVGIVSSVQVPIHGHQNDLDGGALHSLQFLSSVSEIQIFSKTDTSGNSFTIGPTGSGAQKILSSLDTVPAGAQYVFGQVSTSVFHSADAAGSCSSGVNVYKNQAGFFLVGSVTANAYNVMDTDIDSNYIFIPLDASRMFKAQWNTFTTTNSTHTGKFTIIGYIQ